MQKKRFLTVAALVLVVTAVIGGTLAWLVDTTEELNNTFTPSNIAIDLAESENLDLKMIPGWAITKDPKATVKANSEDCYVFVKVVEGIGEVKVGEKTYAFGDFLTYAIAEGWTRGEGTGEGKNGVPTDVWYREVTGSTADQEFPILKDDQVQVRESVTKEMMNAITGENNPTLTFTAYAAQLWKTNKPTGEATTEKFTPGEAWNIASGS